MLFFFTSDLDFVAFFGLFSIFHLFKPTVPSSGYLVNPALHYYHSYSPLAWDKVFKNGPSKICGRQPLKNLKEYGLL